MLRYYPTSKVITNLVARSQEFTDPSGRVYSGKFYLTFDGKAYSGPSPQVGPSKPLTRIPSFPDSNISLLNIPETQKNELASKTGIVPNRIPGKPLSYYPRPTEEDYRKGYLIRYFLKKENETIVMEISEQEYNSIKNGTIDYDITIYQTATILWKITGPLRSQRKSQYNIIPGIIETNQRLTEAANKTFLGITAFIGGEYDKFARPTP